MVAFCLVATAYCGLLPFGNGLCRPFALCLFRQEVDCGLVLLVFVATAYCGMFAFCLVEMAYCDPLRQEATQAPGR